MNIVMTKPALIAHLTERLKLAKAEDEKALRKHITEEEKCLLKFRANLKEAMKWDYAKAKNKYFDVPNPSPPSCPRPEANLIDRELKSVKLDMRKVETFTIKPGTDLCRAVNWVPAAERLKDSVCDNHNGGRR
jgi:hypothetical protein